MLLFSIFLSVHAIVTQAYTDVNIISGIADDVTIRVFGKASPTSELVVCIPGMSLDLVVRLFLSVVAYFP